MIEYVVNLFLKILLIKNFESCKHFLNGHRLMKICYQARFYFGAGEKIAIFVFPQIFSFRTAPVCYFRLEKPFSVTSFTFCYI